MFLTARPATFRVKKTGEKSAKLHKRTLRLMLGWFAQLSCKIQVFEDEENYVLKEKMCRMLPIAFAVNDAVQNSAFSDSLFA